MQHAPGKCNVQQGDVQWKISDTLRCASDAVITRQSLDGGKDVVAVAERSLTELATVDGWCRDTMFLKCEN